MPVYTEMVKDKKTGKMVPKLVNGQKQHYIRTYVTDVNGNKIQITRHNKDWLGRNGFWEAQQEENRLKNEAQMIKKNKIPTKLTVNEAFEQMLENDILYNKNGESTRKTYTYRFYKHISPILGEKTILKLRQEDLNKLINKLKSTKKKYKDELLDYSYINMVLELFERMYTFICKENNIKQKIKFEYIRKNRDEIPNVSLEELITSTISISPDDWEKFCKALETEIDEAEPQQKGTLIKLSLLFSCEYILLIRVGEAQGLKYKNLVSNSGIYVLYEQWNKQLNKLAPLKNRKARLLYIPTEMVQTFNSIYNYLKQNFDICEDDLLFFSEENKNKPISRSTIDRWRKKICQKANINYTTNHEFRHAGISNAMHNEVDVSAISDMAGHTKEVMLSTYVQTLKKANTDLIKTLDNIYLPNKSIIS